MVRFFDLPINGFGIAILLCIAVVGCGSVARDDDLPLFLISPGSRVTLHETLIVPDGESAITFQGGHPVRALDVKRKTPYCSFELPLRDAMRAIAPGDFTVIKIVRGRDWAKLDLLIAQASPEFILQPRIVPELHVTRLYLSAVDRPEMYYLSCFEWWPTSDRDVGVGDARAALSAALTLDVRTAHAN
jgi:hypothetical protein